MQPQDSKPTRIRLLDQLNEQQLVMLNQLKHKIQEAVVTLIDENENSLLERYTEDNQAIRLLWAQDFKVDKAFQMWKRWITWRLDIKADYITEEEIAGEYKSGKCFWHGKDKANNPCLIVKVKNHIPGVSSDIMVKYVLFIIEEGIKKSEEAGTGMVSIIWDREGFNIKNVDYRLFETFKRLNQMIQDNYAERIARVYILYPNWFFKTIFAIVKPFLTERTKRKIIFVDKLQDLQNYFEPNELLKEHGGTSLYQFRYPPINSNQISPLPQANEQLETNQISSSSDCQRELSPQIEESELNDIQEKFDFIIQNSDLLDQQNTESQLTADHILLKKNSC